MTKYLMEESGKSAWAKKVFLNGEQCIFMAPPARFVPKLMEDLFDWMTVSKK